jgi:hypothetical protein
MKSLCSDTNGDGQCDQCGGRMFVGVAGQCCPAADREKGRPVTPRFTGMGLPVPSVRTRRSAPCMWLGEPNGRRLKLSCGGKDELVDEHVCYNTLRRRKSRHNGAMRYGLCTPKGACKDAAVRNRVQPCATCELYEPQQTVPI